MKFLVVFLLAVATTNAHRLFKSGDATTYEEIRSNGDRCVCYAGVKSYVAPQPTIIEEIIDELPEEFASSSSSSSSSEEDARQVNYGKLDLPAAVVESSEEAGCEAAAPPPAKAGLFKGQGLRSRIVNAGTSRISTGTNRIARQRRIISGWA